LGHDLSESRIGFLGGVSSLLSSGFLGSLSLNSDSGDQSLDLGGLGSGFLLVVGSQVSSDNEFGNVIFPVQVEKLSDLGSSFGTQSFVSDGIVGQTGNISFTSLDNDHRDSGHIVVVDTTSNRLSLSFTDSLGSITRSTSSKKQSLSFRSQNTLFHGETLFVFTTGKSDDITFVFITEGIDGNFHGNSLFEDVFVSVFIIDFDAFLLAGGRVSEIKFHVFVLK
jgi:hypothetical protein